MHFICSLYDLANVVSTLAKFYHQASEAYEQACTRHISMIIYYVSDLNSGHSHCLQRPIMFQILFSEAAAYISCLSLQHFERLFEFARRIEESMYNLTPEEVNSVN